MLLRGFHSLWGDRAVRRQKKHPDKGVNRELWKDRGGSDEFSLGKGIGKVSEVIVNGILKDD